MSVLNTLLAKVFPVLVVASVMSGCSTMSDSEYGNILDARPMPATSEEVTTECAWIGQERSVINQRIDTVNTTKGFTAWVAPTVTMQENRLIRLLNARSETVGCDETVSS